MDTIMNFFSNIWNNIVVLATSGNIFVNIIDILIVTFIIYKAIQFLRDTRAEQLMKGIFVFVIALFLARLVKLKALTWLLDTIYVNAIVVLVVLFQPELRSILEYLGRGSMRRFNKFVTRSGDTLSNGYSRSIDAVCAACADMSKDKVGALIVFERDTMLGEIAATGTTLEADPSRSLICNIFFKNTPLHDGAMIIRKNKIFAAGCILPLTANSNIDQSLGTRHRASIGVSEVSDAIVVVVSEETGVISVVRSGKIKRNYTPATLKTLLTRELIGGEQDNDQPMKKPFHIFSKRKSDGGDGEK